MEFLRFKGNVKDLCDKLGIENPVQERDVQVMALCFWTDNRSVTIPGTGLNRVSRLFFQELVPEGERRNYSTKSYITCGPAFTLLFNEFFAEMLEHEPRKGVHQLLDAARTATMAEVFWKD